MPGANEFIDLLNHNQNIIHKVCNLYMDNISDREDLFQEIILRHGMLTTVLETNLNFQRGFIGLH